MRALLTIALLALLATGSLAKFQGPSGKPGPKPKPWKPVTGKVAADSAGVDFAGKPFVWTVPGDNVDSGKVNIVSSLDGPGMDWQVVGDAYAEEDAYRLANVTWAYGAVVKVWTEEVVDEQGSTDTDLRVTLFGDKVKELWPGGNLNLGALVSISFKPERRNAPRVVEIVVKPFIKIVVTQPWIKPIKRFGNGHYADYVTAAVTLTEKPRNELTGLLVPTRKDA